MPQTSKKNYLELVGIVIALGIIFLIWNKYPAWIESKDKPIPVKEEMQSKQTPTLTFDALFQQEPTFIPYKLPINQELLTASVVMEPSPTQLQALGEKYGTFGDTYGALNTLFSGFAFAVLIISLFMQRQELKAQREELAEQRNELIAQRKEAEQGNKIAEEQRKITAQQATLIKQQIDEAKVQNFYTFLFQYLVDLDKEVNKLESIDAFATRFIQLLPPTNNNPLENINLLKTEYYGRTRYHKFDLNKALFLDNIIMIIKFIEENQTVVNHQIPIKTLLSHLSSDLLLCITWIAIIKNQELKLMIENYGLLRNLTRQLEPKIIEELKNVIDEKAFREI